MKYVLDSSVALKWVLPETDSPKAVRLRNNFRRQIHEFIAPDTFLIEVAHSLSRAERKNIIKPPQGSKRLLAVMGSVPQLHPYIPLAVDDGQALVGELPIPVVWPETRENQVPRMKSRNDQERLIFMDKTSFSLLEKLRQPAAGGAWKRFAQIYTPVLYSWASKAGLQESDAADLVQEVFVVLWQKMAEFQYDRSGSFRAWLRTVTMNKLRDWKRREARAPQLADVAVAEAVAKAESYWEIDFRRELMQRALALLQTDFAPTTWQACWEFITSGKTAAEVARQFGITENAVFIAKCKIIRRLRQELQGMLD